MMLMPTDSAESSSMTQVTIRWRHDDAYAQALSVISMSTSAEFGRLGQIFGLCEGP